MKLDPDFKFVTLTGQPVQDEAGLPVILRDVACMALLHAKGDLKTQEKHARWKLAQAIAKAEGEMTIAAEDALRLKDAVGSIYGPLIVGPLVEMIDG